jgi:glutathione S-transferase
MFMKLLYSPASPFARKVRVLAAEAGIAGRIEIVTVSAVPSAPAPDFAKDNPLAKIPTLIIGDADVLYDSRVIAEFLDTIHSGTALFPVPGPARWTALRRQALADGAMDAAILARYESILRPAELNWPDWVAGQKGKITRALDALEAEADHLSQQVTIGEISIACLLEYLDFRFAEDAWRNGRPKLAAFAASFGARPSMISTRPA